MSICAETDVIEEAVAHANALLGLELAGIVEIVDTCVTLLRVATDSTANVLIELSAA